MYAHLVKAVYRKRILNKLTPPSHFYLCNQNSALIPKPRGASHTRHQRVKIVDVTELGGNVCQPV